MARRIDVQEVQSWLETTKLPVAAINPDVEDLHATYVIGRLRGRFDVSAWVDEDTTPTFIKQLIGMRYAASEYRKALSEDLLGDADGLNWAEWLEKAVDDYIMSLLDGSITLEDNTLEDSGLMRPAFYPNDTSSVDDPAKFTMTAEF